MLRLEFNYSKKDLANERRDIDWKTAGRTEFNYHFTAGSIAIWQENKLVNPDWHPHCVLDFALCLNAIAEKLRKAGGTELFEFQEGEGEIRFARNGDKVCLTIVYETRPTVELTVEIRELVAESRRFLGSVLDDALKRHPELARNSVFAGLRPRGKK